MTHPVECPYCDHTFKSNAEYVDVGFGPGVQVTGNVCDRCYATERGAYQSRSQMDKVTGWFTPSLGHALPFDPTAKESFDWLDTLLENVFAMGVRHGAHLAPHPNEPPEGSLAPTLAREQAPTADPVPF